MDFRPGKRILNTKSLKCRQHSYLPNKRAGPNKRVGWKIGQNQIIVLGGKMYWEISTSREVDIPSKVNSVQRSITSLVSLP